MADTETSIERIMKNLQVKGHILGIAVGQGKGQSLAPPNKIIAAKQGWSHLFYCSWFFRVPFCLNCIVTGWLRPE